MSEQPSEQQEGASPQQASETPPPTDGQMATGSESNVPLASGAQSAGAGGAAESSPASDSAAAGVASGAGPGASEGQSASGVANGVANGSEQQVGQSSSPTAATAESTPASSRAKSVSAQSHRSATETTRTSRTSGPSSSRSPSPSNGTSAKSSQHTTKRKRMRLGELDLNTAKIGFLGAGKMAESTVNGLIHYAKISPSRIHVAAPSSRGLERFKALGCRVTKRNYDIFGRYDCDIIFLAFHGYVVKHCYKLGGARPHPITTNYIPHQRHPIYVLSLVSGISLSQIRACLLNPESANRYSIEMHRLMMNTAVGHGLGICAIDCEPDSKKLSAPIRQLLSSIAQLEMVPAAQMDAACAAGGSGLAFAYYFINALADGATKMGLSRAQAIRFASKTAQCAAQTMLESGKHPAELRDQVSSPSGAAIYGLHVLDKNDVASGVSAAVEAAHKRLSDLATQDVERS